MADPLRPITPEEQDAWANDDEFPPSMLIRNRGSRSLIPPWSEARYVRVDVALDEIERLRRALKLVVETTLDDDTAQIASGYLRGTIKEPPCE